MNAQTTYDMIQQNPELVADGQRRMQAVLARSATDREFRQKLITTPRVAIAEFAGVDVSVVPASFDDVKFIENTAGVTVVLPDLLDAESALSEQQLEAVAGGSELVFGLLALGVGIAALYYAGKSDGADACR